MRIIHWFRKDLRLTDNTALLQASELGEVIPVYLLSNWKETHRWTGYKRQTFLCTCLKSLERDIRSQGGQLVIRQEADHVRTLIDLARQYQADAISLNRDYDPHGRELECQLQKAADQAGIRLIITKDRVLHEATEVLTKAKKPFTVFTPYGQTWRGLPKEKPNTSQPRFAALPPIQNPELQAHTLWELTPETGIQLPDGGESAAQQRLRNFLEHRILNYKDTRDILAQTNSRISQDLRFGTLSIRAIYQAVEEIANSANLSQQTQIGMFVNELAWREFYMAILVLWPHILEQNFTNQFPHLQWDDPQQEDTQDKFEAWKTGQTGFPIVDAAMRELLTTGYMHNRARMITAMFLTKDLHIHWKHGESHFLQHLLDGEIASNNGGWQWSAGTGADAAPYFRIQNPWLQTKRYDRDGTYIHHWIPELRTVSAQLFWNPPKERFHPDYPEPIVEHAKEKEVTLQRFLAAKAK